MGIDFHGTHDGQCMINNTDIRTLVEINEDPILMTDLQGNVIDVNQAMLQLLGLQRSKVMNKKIARFFTEPKQIDALFALVCEKGETLHVELRLNLVSSKKNISDSSNLVFFKLFRYGNLQDEPQGTIFLARDANLNNPLNQIDPVTGLSNRDAFIHKLKLAIEASLNESTPFSVFSIDLDNFKKINFSYDYQVGDHVLREIGTRLLSLLAKDDCLARTGGDEYVILSLRVKSKPQIHHFAQSILNKIKERITFNGNTIHLTGSIGVSVYPQFADNALGLLREAEVSMYKAKMMNGDCYYFGESFGVKEFNDKILLENALHQAIINKEFELHYQPILSFKTGEVVALEALLRWRTADGVLKYPDQFLPALEELNMMEPIGFLVIDLALHQLIQIKKKVKSSVIMAINFSATQLSPLLVDYLLDKITALKITPRLIRIELTENSILESNKLSQNVIQKLHSSGVQLSIDDFGMEYSSLRYLKIFSIDNLKLDKLFVEGLPASAYSTAIISAILAMARALDISVTAEGIETADQFTFLQSNGCDEAQGFLLSHPLPEDKLISFLLQPRETKYVEVLPNSTCGQVTSLNILKSICRPILEAMPDALILCDSAGNIILVNLYAEKIFGYTKQEMLGQPIEFLIPDDYVSQHKKHRAKYMKSPHTRAMGSYFELVAKHKNGHDIPVEISLSPLYTDNNNIIIAIIRDVTERKKNQETKAILSAIVTGTEQVIIGTDIDGKIFAWNQGAEVLYGYTEAEMIGQSIQLIIPETHKKELTRIIKQVMKGKPIKDQQTFRIHKDGHNIPVSQTISPIKDAKNVIIGISTIARDISEQQRLEQELRHLAEHDPLTGLINRIILEDRLEHAISLADRHQDNLAVLYLDLDNFKKINDHYGHSVGDALLCETANCLLKCIRGSDSLSRFGGDEFVILLTEIKDEHYVTNVAKKIALCLKKGYFIQNMKFQVTSSIGIALYPKDGSDLLIQKADTAMYYAKAQGKNNIKLYNPSLSMQFKTRFYGSCGRTPKSGRSG